MAGEKHLSKHAAPEKEKKGCLGTFFKIILTLLLIVVLAVGGLIGFLSATEYKPQDTETAEVMGGYSKALAIGDSFRIMSWNIGYGALGDNADFFMDGGTMVKTADADRLNSNMDGIVTEIKNEAPDILLLQEIDRDSARSNHVDETELIRSNYDNYMYSFANNFKVAFLPYPVPPIGKVDSGVATLSAFAVDSAERVQLPIPFSWPVRMANLKRCVLVNRIPVEGTDAELVIFDLHLEAYDDGQGKIAQTEKLAALLNEELEKGNYVIAGGDFNQIFSTADQEAFPAQEDKWQPGVIDVSSIGDRWQFIMDSSVPSCRSLDQPYAGADKETFQYYLIDGFIVSDNIKVNKAGTRDLGFVVSDHNPVVMDVTLKGAEGKKK